MTPVSVLPYMPRGVTPKVDSTKSQVTPSIGSPVKDTLAGAKSPGASRPERRSIRYTVGAAAKLVTPNAVTASTRRSGTNLPEYAPAATPSASGLIVPCHSPCPQAGDDGQKYRSPARSPTPKSAATIRVTTDRWVWRTASGSARVVPEVYCSTARSSPEVVGV